MSEMYQLHVIAMLWCCCEAASISLFPLGMVSVCPGGQLSLTCERTSGSILHWNISVPPPMATTYERFILTEGAVLSPEFKIGFTEFNISRTSDSPLISQLLINNVTTEINGSTIHCSEDRDEINAPMITISIKYKDDILRSMDFSLNITMVNQILGSNDVTVILEWPREAGALYHISISPEISHIESHSVGYFAINLTISYNIQYNVSIVSSLCGVTTIRVLKYVACNYPPIHHLVAMSSKSQDSPPIEGQFLTYTCPPGFNLTGPSMSVCTGNREWEPDPGEVDCIADDCGSLPVNRNIKLDYISTLEGFVTLTCDNAEILNVTCHSNGSWIPDPADFIESCSPFTVTTLGLATLSQGLINKTSDSEDSLLLIILAPSTIFTTMIIFIVFMLTLCAIMRMCVAKKTLDEDHIYEDPTYKNIVL